MWQRIQEKNNEKVNMRDTRTELPTPPPSLSSFLEAQK